MNPAWSAETRMVVVSCPTGFFILYVIRVYTGIIERLNSLYNVPCAQQWYHIQLFQLCLISFEDSVCSGKDDRIDICEYIAVYMIALWISLSLMELLAVTMLQISCTWW